MAAEETPARVDGGPGDVVESRIVCPRAGTDTIPRAGATGNPDNAEPEPDMGDVPPPEEEVARGTGPRPDPYHVFNATEALAEIEPILVALRGLTPGECAPHDVTDILAKLDGLRLSPQARQTCREELRAPVKNTRVIGSPAGVIDRFLPYPEREDDDQESQAKVMVRLAIEAGVELYHSADEREWITVTRDDHQETWAVRSKHTRGWLRNLYYAQTENPPGNQGVQDAIEQLAAMALHEGPVRELALRVCGDAGVVRVDLGGPEWRYVHVDAAGWTIRPGAARWFRRGQAMLPLPEPVRGGGLRDLRRHLNATCDDTWHLMSSWLVSALRPAGPYPVLVVMGEHGSAKSSACRILRALVDPCKGGLRAPPKDLRDLAIAAEGSWVVAYENLSHLGQQLSDGLCRLATGAAFATRQLWTDSDEAIFEATRPVVLNGIGEVVSAPDLLDRAYLVTLPPFVGTQRPEAELWQDFNADAPRILGGVLDAVSEALRCEPTTQAPPDVRMQDAARWAEASAGAWTDPGAPLAAIRKMRHESTATVIEGSPVAAAIIALGERRRGEPWVGTAAELLAELEAGQDEKVLAALAARKQWPKSPRALSGQLEHLAPVLRAEGADYARLPREGSARAVRLDWTGIRPSSPSSPSLGCKNADEINDGLHDGHDGRGETVIDRHADRHPVTTRNHGGHDGHDGHDGRIPPQSKPPAAGKQVRLEL